MNSLQESSWLAGLLEGEASFMVTAQKGNRPKLIVKLSMTDEDVIERARTVMPGTPSIRAYNKSQQASTLAQVAVAASPRPHQVYYETVWCGQSAENLMQRILPYMGKRRSAKIRESLATPNLSHHTRETV